MSKVPKGCFCEGTASTLFLSKRVGGVCQACVLAFIQTPCTRVSMHKLTSFFREHACKHPPFGVRGIVRLHVGESARLCMRVCALLVRIFTHIRNFLATFKRINFYLRRDLKNASYWVID